MRSSRKTTEKRSVFDVHTSKIFGAKTLNLRPKFRVRHPWITGAATLVIAMLVLFGARRLFTRAEVSDFYPSSCLGTWHNSANAQGSPENLSLGFASSTFNTSNSAAFAGPSTQIYCGGFLPPDFKPTGNITRVGITFLWNMSGGSIATSTPAHIATSTTTMSTGENAPSEAASTTTVASPPPLPDVSAPAASTSTPNIGPSSTTSFLFNFWQPILTAFAEDTSTPSTDTTTTAAIPPPISAPAASDTTTTAATTTATTTVITNAAATTAVATTSATSTAPIILGPPISADLSPLATTTASTTTTTTESIAASSTLPAPPPPPPDQNFLEVSYSTDGTNWISLAKINPTNWQNFTISLPITNWDDIKKLQIKIGGIPTSLTELPSVLLDGMFVEAQYEIPPVAIGPAGSGSPSPQPAQTVAVPAPAVIVLPPQNAPLPAGGDTNFKADEAPSFDLDLGNLPAPTPPAPPPVSAPTSSPTSLLRNASHALASALGFFLRTLPWGDSASAQTTNAPGAGLPTSDNPVVAKILDPENHETGLQPTFVFLGSTLRVLLPQPGREFKPGAYSLKLWVWRNGAVYHSENTFSWGVLAVNFNKSIYTLGDKANIGFAVLTNLGHTVCNAAIDADITSPGGHLYRISTQNKTIVRNPTCGPQTVTNDPDYSAALSPDEAGTYQVSVTADAGDGRKTITDSFDVKTQPLFDVERISPTRIYPPSIYEVTIKVKANEDFNGQITESVPASFEINASPKTLSWNVDLKKGAEVDLAYSFKAPDVSPELYKLGPLQIGTWAESRQWQIAADAAGDVILLWDGTSANIPAGWTCISCAATDPFFGGVFPRASSTYGTASSSANTVTHNASSSAVGGGAASAKSGASGSVVPANTHTHSINAFTTGSGDIRPPTLELLLIKAATTTIPTGAIGMFDVASSSLPSSWTWYSQMNGNYVAGDAATSSVGAATHTHSISASSTAASNTLVPGGSGGSGTIGGPSHTHGISGTSPSASNNPPFINMVFAKSNTTSTLDATDNGLIALFDNTALPTNWNVISTSGSAYAGQGGLFFQGSDTFGATGGSATHTHASTTITSAGPSVTTSTKSTAGTTFSLDTHTHNFVITFDTQSSIPMFRYVILGKFTAPPVPLSVSKVVLNSNGAIILTPNTTKTISVVASTTAGANPILYATSTIYRSGVGATCAANNLNCYQLASSSCSFSAATTTVTCSANIQYFAQATDASSSFPAQNWQAAITITDSAAGTSNSSTAAGVALNTLLAINVTTSSVNYGTLVPNTNTGAINQTTTVQNAGNSSTTLSVSGTDLSTTTRGGDITSNVISTATIGTSTENSMQRKLIYDSINGKYWAFYGSGSNISYSNSSNGSGWSSIGSTGSSTRDFSVWPVDGSTTVYMAYKSSGVSVQKGILSPSSISWSAPVMVTPTSTAQLVNISRDSNGRVWIVYIYNAGGFPPTLRYVAVRTTNPDDLSALDAARIIFSATGIGLTTPTAISMTTAGNMYFIYYVSNTSSGEVTLRGRLWQDAGSLFGTEVVIDILASTTPSADLSVFSAVSQNTDEVDLLYDGEENGAASTQNLGTIRFARYSGGTWATSTSKLDTNTTNSDPTLIIDKNNANNLYATWIQSSTAILMKKGVSPYALPANWDSSSTSLVAAGTNLYLTGSYQNAGNYMPLEWTEGTASPFNVRFYGISTTSIVGATIAATNEHYATSSFTFGGAEQTLANSASTVSGFLLTAPTSTVSVQNNTFWGIQVPAGQTMGTYTGTVTFTASFSP